MAEKKRILIVDDDTEIRDLLEFDIASSGYFVDTASDGMEGLTKALNNKYDLILLDVMMPKMNGFEVCQNIRQAKNNVPILMLTAKGTIGDKTTGFDSFQIMLRQHEQERMELSKKQRNRIQAFKKTSSNSEQKDEQQRKYERLTAQLKMARITRMH